MHRITRLAVAATLFALAPTPLLDPSAHDPDRRRRAHRSVYGRGFNSSGASRQARNAGKNGGRAHHSHGRKGR